MTDSVGSTGNITGTATGTAKTTSSTSGSFDAGMGKDTFLKLLVAQLKYQNPLSPTDSEQYMAQMASFTQVEKLSDIQQSQTDLLSWQRTVAGQGMIGKNITATPSSGTGDVSGKVVGLRLTDAGPRLLLDSGVTVSVDEVTAVNDGSTGTAAQTSTSGSASSGAATTPTSTGTTGTTTPPATTGTTTPPATTGTTGTTGGTTGTAGTTTGTGTTGG